MEEQLLLRFSTIFVAILSIIKNQIRRLARNINSSRYTTQSWFPVFRKMLVSKTNRLRAKPYIFFLIDREQSVFWNKLFLVAGIVSGKVSN